MQNRFIYICLILLTFSCSPGGKVQADKGKDTLTEKQKIQFGNYYMDATKEKLLGNYDKAEELYKKAIDIDEASAAAHYELGLVHNYQKNFELALQQFEMASQLDPDNYWYKISYGSFLEANNRVDEAIEIFQELAQKNPKKVELKLELSKLLITQKKYDEGIDLLNEVEKEVGVNEEISFLKQQIYLYKNDVNGAANEIENLIQANPSDMRYYGILSDIYLSNGKDDKAYEVFKRMKKLDSSSFFVNMALADYYKTKNQEEKYLAELKLAFNHPEMDIDAKIKHILTNYRIDSQDEAQMKIGIELCHILTKAHPKDAKSYALYADFLYFNEQLEDAKQAYFKTIELDSSRFPVWNQLLVILSELNDNKNSISYGKRAIDLFPNQASSYLLTGFAYAQEEEHENAIKYFNLGKDFAISNDGLKGQFYASLGDSYHALDAHEQSDKAYDKALQIDPSNVYVLNNYSYYLSVRKEKLELAKEMSLKSNTLSPGQPSFQDTYAWILFQLGNYEEANVWIDKALSSDSNSGVLLEHKGDILYKLGESEKAMEFWRKAKTKGGGSGQLERKIKEGKWYE